MLLSYYYFGATQFSPTKKAKKCINLNNAPLLPCSSLSFLPISSAFLKSCLDLLFILVRIQSSLGLGRLTLHLALSKKVGQTKDWKNQYWVPFFPFFHSLQMLPLSGTDMNHQGTSLPISVMRVPLAWFFLASFAPVSYHHSSHTLCIIGGSYDIQISLISIELPAPAAAFAHTHKDWFSISDFLPS